MCTVTRSRYPRYSQALTTTGAPSLEGLVRLHRTLPRSRPIAERSSLGCSTQDCHDNLMGASLSPPGPGPYAELLIDCKTAGGRPRAGVRFGSLAAVGCWTGAASGQWQLSARNGRKRNFFVCGSSVRSLAESVPKSMAGKLLRFAGHVYLLPRSRAHEFQCLLDGVL